MLASQCRQCGLPDEGPSELLLARLAWLHEFARRRGLPGVPQVAELTRAREAREAESEHAARVAATAVAQAEMSQFTGGWSKVMNSGSGPVEDGMTGNTSMAGGGSSGSGWAAVGEDDEDQRRAAMGGGWSSGGTQGVALTPAQAAFRELRGWVVYPQPEGCVTSAGPDPDPSVDGECLLRHFKLEPPAPLAQPAGPALRHTQGHSASGANVSQSQSQLQLPSHGGD